MSLSLGFSTDRIKIRNIIDKAFKGTILIPEFQRDFIWKAEDIKELLTSILGGYFIGTILLHRNTKKKIEFCVKPLPALESQKVESIDEDIIVDIVLDGQQRLNSILYSVTSTSQHLQGSKNPHRFFLHVPSLTEGNLHECIVYTTENKTNKKYKEILDKEYFALKQIWKDTGSNLNFAQFLKEQKKKIEYINLSKLFDSGANDEIIDDIHDILKDTSGKEKAQKVRSALRSFLDFEIFYIQVPQEAELGDIVEIFERINKTSYKLSTPDLLFAKLRKEGLRKKEIVDLIESIVVNFPSFKDVKELDSSLLFKVLALLIDKEPKPKQLITITAKDYKDYKDILKDALRKSLEFLQNELGVSSKNIAYTSMLVPLIAMFAFFLKQKQQQDLKRQLMNFENLILKYIKQWYFSNVFSERYDEGAATKAFQDYKKFIEFIDELIDKGRSVESKIKDFINVESIDLQEFQKPKAKNSALLKGFMSLLVLNEVRDFVTEARLTALNATDEHIFPKKFFSNRKKADIVLNRTLSAPSTNKTLKSGQRPSLFFKELEKNKDIDKLRHLLQSHFIEEKAIDALKKDDFNSFIEARLEAVRDFLIKKELVPAPLIKL